MTTMIAEVYDALREAGASDEKTRRAAEAVSTDNTRLARIEARLTLLTWANGLVLVAIVIPLLKSLLG